MFISPLSFKQRDPNQDFEAAYRHGFVQGVAAVMAGLYDKVSAVEQHQIEHWFDFELMPWSLFMGLEDKMPAPDLPALSGTPKTRGGEATPAEICDAFVLGLRWNASRLHIVNVLWDRCKR